MVTSTRECHKTGEQYEHVGGIGWYVLINNKYDNARQLMLIV